MVSEKKTRRIVVLLALCMLSAFPVIWSVRNSNRLFNDKDWLLSGANFSDHYCKDPIPPAGGNTGCNVCQYHGEILVEYMPGMYFVMKLWKRCNGPADGKCLDMCLGAPNRLCRLTETACPASATPRWYQDADCSNVVAYTGENHACEGQQYLQETSIPITGVSCTP